jgi:putative FmdB family regulatory protein
MPFYDFKCANCSADFEIMAKMSQKEDKSIKCPECGSTNLSTLYGSFNVIQTKNNDAPSCPHIDKCGGCAK